jgi:hypothetical protein
VAWWPGGLVAWSGSNGQDLVVELIDQVQRGGGIGGGEGLSMKRSKEIVEIVEADDLTGRYRAAAKLTGCDRHTVPRMWRCWMQGRCQRRASAGRALDE